MLFREHVIVLATPLYGSEVYLGVAEGEASLGTDISKFPPEQSPLFATESEESKSKGMFKKSGSCRKRCLIDSLQI